MAPCRLMQPFSQNLFQISVLLNPNYVTYYYMFSTLKIIYV